MQDNYTNGVTKRDISTLGHSHFGINPRKYYSSSGPVSLSCLHCSMRLHYAGWMWKKEAGHMSLGKPAKIEKWNGNSTANDEVNRAAVHPVLVPTLEYMLLDRMSILFLPIHVSVC